ncbi:hypothetical protein [Syntrophaceticus schinkii]|uniref:Uncharacterized protein n=1 Tax=Syntrophaceticus schinkii TaxID=499207 RepID=A0A0B7MS48_9FIRM|nr:hypothetical protein [Syntrophaceticus schinkii]CEO90507.1 hypothetical protein SSCH_920002 [Syntrophaceticus schinkii]
MVEDDQGNTHEAFAYVMTQKGSQEPSEAYYNIIKQGYQDWLLPVLPSAMPGKEAPTASGKLVSSF